MGFSIREKGEGEGGKGKDIFLFFFPFSFFPFLFSLLPRFISIFVIIITFITSATAAPYTQDLNDFINVEMKTLVNSDIVMDALSRQNSQNANIAESNLRVMDNNWKSELRKMSQPLISQILNNDLSKFLRKTVDASNGVYTEITIIDSKGLSVSQTVVSDSYLSIDKPRWEKTFKEKSYNPYISDIYYSDETSKFQVEVSFMIISDEQPVGIITAGIDVEQLEEWRKHRK